MLYNRYFYQILKTIDLVVVLVYYKAMETIECIESRHSCRNFLKNKKVEKELVLDILKTGALAPSAKNRQS